MSATQDPKITTTEIKPPQSSVNFRIDELEGAVVRKFFKDDLEPRNSLEFEPKLKTANGFAKLKVGLHLTKEANVKYADEAEFQNKIGGSDYSLKLKEKEVSLHLDRDLIPVGNHWVNTYLLAKFPRSFGGGLNGVTTTLGSIFHLNLKDVTGRIHSEVVLKHNNQQNQLHITENSFVKFCMFNLAMNRTINLTGKFSVFEHGLFSITRKNASFFLESKTNKVCICDWKPSSVAVGGSYNIDDNLKVFAVGTRTLDETKETHLNVGAEYKHCEGVSTKLAYFHKDRVSGFFNFKLSPSWTAGITLQQNISGDNDLLWGAKFKFNV